MKKLLVILAMILTPTLALSRGVGQRDIQTATDQILYDNLGSDSGYSWPVDTIASGDSSTTVVSIKAGYHLMGLGVYTTTNAIITVYGDGINCVDLGSGADSVTNIFNPAEAFNFLPFKDCDSVRVDNSSGESCNFYLTVWTKR